MQITRMTGTWQVSRKLFKNPKYKNITNKSIEVSANNQICNSRQPPALLRRTPGKEAEHQQTNIHANVIATQAFWAED